MNISTKELLNLTSRVKNIPYKLRREFLKIPALSAIQEQSYQKALKERARFLPQVDNFGTSVLTRLRNEGTCIVPIEKLGLGSTPAMLNTAYLLADRLRHSDPIAQKVGSCEISCDKNDFREFPEILLWALEPKLLDLVENYIGLPILYQGFGMRRSIADGRYSGVRRWHVDWEDRRMIKIIIYLNDVVAGGGPYEYIARNNTAKAIETLNYYNLGYLSDEEMQKAVPQEDWIACFAPGDSVIITDTSSVFHRAQPPTVKERFSITFCYTSASPQVIWKSRKTTRQQWQIIDRHTNDRQKSCLPKRRIGVDYY